MISDREKCFQQKLNQQIFNAILNWALNILNFDCQKWLLHGQERLEIKLLMKKSEFFTLNVFRDRHHAARAIWLGFFLVHIISIIYALQYVQNLR